MIRSLYNDDDYDNPFVGQPIINIKIRANHEIRFHLALRECLRIKTVAYRGHWTGCCRDECKFNVEYSGDKLPARRLLAASDHVLC